VLQNAGTLSGHYLSRVRCGTLKLIFGYVRYETRGDLPKLGKLSAIYVGLCIAKRGLLKIRDWSRALCTKRGQLKFGELYVT
jgi:hypothetical protein